MEIVCWFGGWEEKVATIGGVEFCLYFGSF